ncbi:uncharacterized protein M421DRAFT_420651 [Didymella exigua CBS 183.55]|uniref:Uncharacterized protein n=1 Tax=Didymella exigua CBS 183.55 TaxID=1150837 RepID=A0A6A5RNN8_9PLEO|nr:uncharacterized protein M421DRAFT_420651 [Didymella exigua CBS 183.55]KAF1928758.1 hypothetical protein M421DRAFT_420651 [Didymella exigua CBS 183.55]
MTLTASSEVPAASRSQTLRPPLTLSSTHHHQYFRRKNDFPSRVNSHSLIGRSKYAPIRSWIIARQREVFERYEEVGGRVDQIKVTQEPVEAARNIRIKDVKACHAWKASTLQLWKLTARDDLKNGDNLQTYTVAKSVTDSTEGPRGWTAHTDREDIARKNVIHAIDAYSAALEPALKGIIIPKPHICTKVLPPRASRATRNSYEALFSDGGLLSINARCNADGHVIFGGSNPGQQAFSD